MKKIVSLAALALAALALVACGSSDDNSGATSGGGGGESQSSQEIVEEASGGSPQTINFEADPAGGLAYTTDEVTAKAGKTKVNFNNPQGLTHDLVIEDSSGNEIARDELVQEGSTTTTVNLKPGTYTFVCTVPGHREAGMDGTLVVE